MLTMNRRTHSCWTRLVWVLFIQMLWCGQLTAETTQVKVSAEGHGLTRQHAVVDALTNATAQAFGFSLSSASASSMASEEKFVDDQQSSRLIEEFNKQIHTQVKTDTARPVTGYVINSVTEAPNGGWSASVTMSYVAYVKPGVITSRQSVVINITSPAFPDLVAGAVESALVATRRFDVLSRNHSALFEQERKFITGSDAATTEIARLSGGLGADYLVVVDLQDFSVTNDIRDTIKMTGEVFVSSVLQGNLRMRVIEFTSRKIKWTGTQAIAQRFMGAPTVTTGMLSASLKTGAQSLVAKMVGAIYPMRVVRRDGDALVLNRGEGSVAIGESFTVYLLGDELLDPQSGESLGWMETVVGSGVIVDVKPKFSVLKLNAPVGGNSDSQLLVRYSQHPGIVAQEKPNPPPPVDDSARNRSLLKR